ncbi:Hsp70 family protein [Dactylosporangium sp. NPDC049742]|uniref:Hsp70 family protein n=1 Tax=Dactylosporangium sp. NPDC049742 TaxID=3154737 RepID=UPI0034374879
MIAVRYRLGIDFGTSNTVAVIHENDGRSRPVLFDGFPLLPSCVCLALDGQGLLVGREAMHAARVHPERYEPHPKRRIDDGTVLLGDTEHQVATLIAATLARVRAETVRTMGDEPGTVVITYPAAWGPRRRSVLLDAARLAGLGTPQLVPEPVAAAAFFVAATDAAVPVGSRVVVYDFGAGTFDASVVTRTATGWDVIASEGLDDAGGLDVDTAIVEYLSTVHSTAHPDEMRRLTSPQTVADRRANRNLWEDVRTAKEILSRSASTYIHVPLVEQDAPLGREQLERLARPVVDRTVALTRTVLTSAEPARPLAGLFLVGGSSRMPLVATLLHQATGVAPTVLEQPELVVAEGSARPLATTGAQPAGDAADVRQSAADPLWPQAAPSHIPATGPAAAADGSIRGVASVRPPQTRPSVPHQPPTPVSGAAAGAVYGTPAAAAPAAPPPPASTLPPPAAARPGSPPAGVPAAESPMFSIPPVSGRPAAATPPPGAGWSGAGIPVSGPPDAAWSTSSPPEQAWPDNGPVWPISPSAFGPAAPTSPAAHTPPAPASPASNYPAISNPVINNPAGSANSAARRGAASPANPVSPAGDREPAVAAFGAGAPPSATIQPAPTTQPPAVATTPAPGAVRKALVTAGLLLGALLLFGFLGRKAYNHEWHLPFEFSNWRWWIGEARIYLFPGFVLWLAYLFAAPASRPVVRTVAYGLLLIPAMIIMAEVGVVVGWAGGTTGMFVLLIVSLLATVALLAARRKLDGTEVKPVFGRTDAGGLALGVTVAILAAAPEYRYLIELFDSGDVGLVDALKINEVPMLHWFVFGPSVTLAFVGLAAAVGRLIALTMPAVARWLPRIAAVVLVLGALVAVSRITTGLYD